MWAKSIHRARQTATPGIEWPEEQSETARVDSDRGNKSCSILVLLNYSFPVWRLPNNNHTERPPGLLRASGYWAINDLIWGQGTQRKGFQVRTALWTCITFSKNAHLHFLLHLFFILRLFILYPFTILFCFFYVYTVIQWFSYYGSVYQRYQAVRRGIRKKKKTWIKNNTIKILVRINTFTMRSCSHLLCVYVFPCPCSTAHNK